MIEIFKTTPQNTLQRMDRIEDDCWVNVIDPTTDEVEQLVALGTPLDFLIYPLDVDEIPRVEKEDEGQTLILLRTPYYEGKHFDIPYVAIVMGVILVDKLIITVSKRRNEILEQLVKTRTRGLSTLKRNRFVLVILLNTAKKYLEYLKQINENVDHTEDALQKSLNNKEVLELLKFQKSLVYFETGLRSNQVMMEKLDRTRMFYEYEEDEDLLDDVIIETKQAREMVQISSTILSSMMDAYASIISNNLNDVMKILTSVTIILSLPTLVTSFFGMNVNLPFANLGYAYWLIIAFCAVLIIITLILFVWRKWF